MAFDTGMNCHPSLRKGMAFKTLQIKRLCLRSAFFSTRRPSPEAYGKQVLLLVRDIGVGSPPRICRKTSLRLWTR